ERYYIRDTVRAASNGDTLIINGKDGDDTIDASLLGTPIGQALPSTSPRDIVALVLEGGDGEPISASNPSGDGNDRLIGSPFNDVIDGGTGADVLTGGFGLDTFKSENVDSHGNPVALDTLVETQNTDLGLFGNIFITGQVLNDAGNTPYAEAAGVYALESDMQTDMQDTEDPGSSTDPTTDFRQPGYGEQWRSATVENIAGIFAAADLTGGDGNNTIVVNDVDGKIWVAGQGALNVTTWNGNAILDNADNTGNPDADLPEYYVITNAAGSTAQIQIIDSGGASGSDDLVVFGTNQADTLTLNSYGSGAGAIMYIDASVTSTEQISAQGVDRLEIYTLGGDDHVLSNDTSVTTVVNLGAGDDSMIIGTVPLVPDPGNRTLEYPNGVPVADTAHMTNGNTAPLYVLGGTNDDYFEVDHNVGMLYLAGDAGDDTF